MGRGLKKALTGLIATIIVSGVAVASQRRIPLWQTVPTPAALPADGRAGTVQLGGASIWYESVGRGTCVVLLHPGLADSSFWGNQILPLRQAGHEVILIDSRGHGRSTRDDQPLSYGRMAEDVLQVMDALHRRRCAVVGWSDGAIVGLVLAMRAPARVSRVLAFGANMDLSGVDPRGDGSATFQRYGRLTAESYRRRSTTPGARSALEAAVKAMWDVEPNFAATDLAGIKVPTAIVAGEHDEVIRRSHAKYLARTIPGATLTLLPHVSHFAPLQNPKLFNRVMLTFVGASDR